MRREVEQNLGKLTTSEPTGEVEGKDRPIPEKAKSRRGASAERMREITRDRMRRQASGELPPPTGGRKIDWVKRAKRKPQDVVDEVLDQLMPKALKVLSEQLNSPDEKIAQAAAVKVIEYKMGKPTQQVKAEIDQRIASIRFETQALLPPLPGIIDGLPGGADILELDVGDDSGEHGAAG